MRRAGEAEIEPAEISPGCPPCSDRRMTCCHEGKPPLVWEDPTRFGKLCPMRDSSQQRRTKLCFQLLDLLAEGWLSDPKPGSGSREVQFLGNRDEVSDMLQFQSSHPLPLVCGKARLTRLLELLDLERFDVA